MTSSLPPRRDTTASPQDAKAFSSALRLTGHGLVLREWRDADLATMMELFDDPCIAHRTPIASPFDLAAARDYLHKARQARVQDQRIHVAITTDGRQAKPPDWTELSWHHHTR